MIGIHDLQMKRMQYIFMEGLQKPIKCLKSKNGSTQITNKDETLTQASQYLGGLTLTLHPICLFYLTLYEN